MRIAKQEARLPVVSLITNGIRLRGPLAEGFIRDGLDVVEVDGECLVRLVQDVAIDHDGDGFRRVARVESQNGGRDGQVIGRCGGGTVRSSVFDGHGF